MMVPGSAPMGPEHSPTRSIASSRHNRESHFLLDGRFAQQSRERFSNAAYAASAGVNALTLAWWETELRREARAKPAAPTEKNGFVPLHVTSAVRAPTVEIEFGSGVYLTTTLRRFTCLGHIDDGGRSDTSSSSVQPIERR